MSWVRLPPGADGDMSLIHCLFCPLDPLQDRVEAPGSPVRVRRKVLRPQSHSVDQDVNGKEVSAYANLPLTEIALSR